MNKSSNFCLISLTKHLLTKIARLLASIDPAQCGVKSLALSLQLKREILRDS